MGLILLGFTSWQLVATELRHFHDRFDDAGF